MSSWLFVLATQVLAYEVSLVTLGNGSTKLEGSKTGGTKLIFRGDWGYIYSNNFDIRIGGAECEIEPTPYRVTELVCYTPPQPEESIFFYPLYVYYSSRYQKFGGQSGKFFTYVSGPTLTQIIPQEATPGDQIFYAGDFEASKVLAVTVGSVFATELDRLGNNKQGDLNLALSFEKGQSSTAWDLVQQDSHGRSYNFRTLARIDLLSDFTSGTLGGRDLQIYGKGFPLSGAEITAEVDGAPCEVYTVKRTRLECKTSPQTSTTSKDFYEGGAGLRREIWRNTETPLSELIGSVNPDEVTYAATVQATTDGTKSRFFGLFTAPSAGLYGFHYSNIQFFLDENPFGSGVMSYFEKGAPRKIEIWAENGSFTFALEGPEGDYLPANDTPLIQRLPPPTSEYVIGFRYQTSSLISPSSTAEEVEKQLNAEIKNFNEQLIVVSEEDGSLTFKLPATLFFRSAAAEPFCKTPTAFFRSNNDFIRYSTGARFTIFSVLKDPGDGKYWGIVPSEFLRTIHDVPQLRVFIDGLLAVCAGSCDFQYLEPAAITSYSLTGKILTLNGTDLPVIDYEIAIIVSEVECEIKTVSTSSYTCLLFDGEAGNGYQPVVRYEKTGFLPVTSGESYDFELVIDSVDPVVGGTNGGTFLTIKGRGFSTTIDRAMENSSIMIGCSPCEITTSALNMITCVTSAQITDSTLKLTVNGVTVKNSSFTYDPNFNIEITEVSPMFSSILDIGEVTITGSNFGDDRTMLEVSIGDRECYVNTATDTEIFCKVNGGPPGSYDLVVTRKDFGVQWVSGYRFVFEIDEISVHSGSLYGGTSMVIKGKGFTLRDRAHSVLIGRIGECAIDQVVDSGTILCTTLAINPDLDADTIYEIEVLGKRQELTSCTSDCTFKWTFYESPKVEQITPTEGVSGDVIMIYGHYLGDRPEDIHLFFGDQPAPIMAASNTEVMAIVPTVQGSNPVLSFFVDGKGNGSIPFEFTNLETIMSIVPNQVSVEGAIVRIFGSGLSDQEIVLEGDLYCMVTAVKLQFMECYLGPNICTDGCAVQFLFTSTPQIQEISGDLMITGDFLGEVDFVKLGEYSCPVTSSSLTFITCDPSVPPGTYEIEIHIKEFGFAAGQFTYTKVLAVNEPAPTTSSYSGGKKITLEGSGLFATNTVTVCGFKAEYASDDGTEIFTPALPTLFSQLEYEVEFDYPDITPLLAPIGSNPATVGLAFDEDTSTFYLPPGEKWIGVDAGEGRLIQLKTFSVISGGVLSRNYKDLRGSSVQGSNDLVSWETLFVYDQIDNNENFYSPNPKVIYRAFRIFREDLVENWAINEIVIFGALLLEVTDEEYSCPIEIETATGEKQTFQDAVTYTPVSTPVLATIFPNLGSAAGGELVIFQGTGFEAPATVLIDGLTCFVIAVLDTEIRCQTFPLFFFGEESLEITIESKGKVATRGQLYTYAEKWSDDKTWGGLAPPRENETVYINSGSTVIVDVPIPRLNVLLVEGRLIFEDKPGLDLTLRNIVSRYGEIYIGTEDKPFTSPMTITLTGDKDDLRLPFVTGKDIAVVSGSIDIHGIPRNPTWTLMESSALRGSNSITLTTDVDWQPGEEIAIAPTGYDFLEGEKRVIASVEGRTVFLDRPLDYDHISVIEKYEDTEIDMRCEVGLLTRNIKIVSEEDGLPEFQYGGSVIVTIAATPANGRLSYVQFQKMGKFGRILRYPFHYHLVGFLSDSYARGLSFDESFNRAIVVHGTAYTTIEDNVAFNTLGHTYFLEDGNEFQNIFRRNLAIMTKPSYGLLITDHTPSSFWFSNPENFIYDNRAAGSFGHGFWFDQPLNPPMLLIGNAPLQLCTQQLELGEFRNNTSHSHGRNGFFIEPRSIPVIDSCGEAIDRTRRDWWASNPAVSGFIQNFTAYKNNLYGISAFEIGDYRFQDIILADNLQGGMIVGWTNFSEPFNSVRVTDSVIIGRTNTNTIPINRFIGLQTPQTDGMLFQNIKFYNIEGNMYSLGDSAFGQIPIYADYGGRLHKLSGFEYINAGKKIRWNRPFRGIYEDIDGSVSGIPGAFIAAYWPHLETEDCPFNAELDAIVCNGPKIRRVHFYAVDPEDKLLFTDITVGRDGEYTKLPMVLTDLKKNIKYSWAVPFVTGFEYEVFWQYDWNKLNMEIETFEGDEFVIVNFNVTGERTGYSARRGVVEDDTTLLLETDNLSSSDPAGTYQWGEGFFKMILSGVPGNYNQFNDIEIVADTCCSELRPISIVEEVSVRWSIPENWPTGRLPEEGESVYIDAGVTIILDIVTPVFKYLEVNGHIEFDPLVDVELNSELIYIRAGSISSGSAETPLSSERTHKITLTGLSGFQLPEVDVGSKVMVNTGSLSLYGYSKTPWTLLVQNVAAGENYIFVEDATNWLVGDSIAVSASGFDADEDEVLEITDIQPAVEEDMDWIKKQASRDNGRHNNPDENLETATTSQSVSNVVKVFFDRPLNHYHSGTILIIGDKEMDMRTEVVNLSRNIIVSGSVLTNSQETSGAAMLSHVDFDNAERVALRFENNSEGASVVTGSVIKNSGAGGLHVRDANNIIFERNGLYNNKWRGIYLESSANSMVTSNAILKTVNRGFTNAPTDKDAGFYGCLGASSCQLVRVTGNRSGGSSFAGFVSAAAVCGNQQIFMDNTAHSGYVGWVLANTEGDCLETSGFNAYFNKQGVASVVTVPSIKLANLHLAENKIGLGLRTGIAEFLLNPLDTIEQVTTILQMVSDSVIVGKTQHSPMAVEDCRVGFYTGFGDENPSTDFKMPLYASRGNSHAIGNATFTDLSLANFRYDCQFAIESNPRVPDAHLPHLLYRTKLYSVPESSTVYMNFPSQVCSNRYCTGLLNVLIEDTDGGLVGGNGAGIIPNNPSIASRDICTFRAANNAYFCRYVDENYYEMLVYDEFDERDRQMTPLLIEAIDRSFVSHLGTFFYSQPSGCFDHERNQVVKRRFPSLVYTGMRYNITGVGFAAIEGRLYVQGTRSRNRSISITIEFEQKFESGVLIGDTIYRYIGYSLGEDRNPKLSDPHATNKWHIGLGELEVILRDEVVLTLTDGLNLQMHLNVEVFSGAFTLNPFNDVFIDAALALGYIDPFEAKRNYPIIEKFIPVFEAPEIPGIDF